MTTRGMMLAWVVLAVAMQPPGAAGQGSATEGAQAAKCDGKDYRSFDFWLGEWEVRIPSGDVAGRNRITFILNGCGIREEWTGSQGSVGTSYNMWDAATGRWHQTWVDNQGLLLLLDGGLVEGKMVLRGERPGAGGKPVHHRVTWEPLEGGQVRQLWESSRDGGSTWSIVFDGTYHRVQ